MSRTYISEPSGELPLIPGRCSFSQLLLIFSYVVAESGLSAVLGDHRQCYDLISQNEEDWVPRVGPETFHEMRHNGWDQIDQDTRNDWEIVRLWMHESLICDVSAQQLRNHLCCLLTRIEQVSAQGINVLYAPKMFSGTLDSKIGAQTSLALICISLSVTPTTYEKFSQSAIWSCPTKLMRSKLQRSPLFSNQIYQSDLDAATNSLFMILRETDFQMKRVGPHDVAFRDPRKHEMGYARREDNPIPSSIDLPGQKVDSGLCGNRIRGFSADSRPGQDERRGRRKTI
ncbi:uncharacterized protein N7483_002482 [Penicillium malachiteum]|uniref:uncharacterized protein n=1 Tax=Penicillium malachiteum TaxID=1324776 RepID=UPI002546A126|nr:uncharacterized protein N7483_002482 [Penicillium malachiteum]KAJ5737357.1 hypothetical protein N7483_002482 [Penicillium malachiteum]